MQRKPRSIRRGTDREKAWKAMRVLRTFRAGEIEDTANISRHNINSYLKYLIRTGFLSRRDDGRLVLMRDSGPRPPVTINRKASYWVYDPNTEKYYEGAKEGMENESGNYELDAEQQRAMVLLRSMIEDRGQNQVARELGYGKSTISQVKDGKYPIVPARILEKVMEVYGSEHRNCPAAGEIDTKLCERFAGAVFAGRSDAHPLFAHVKGSCKGCEFYTKGKR